MYYTESGDEFKKFNTHDGMGIRLLMQRGVKTGFITSESTRIVERRAAKLKIDYLYRAPGKSWTPAREICARGTVTGPNGLHRRPTSTASNCSRMWARGRLPSQRLA
jgi:3-deoxy-D-manno-octulosonate 8-phosphate phosphatase KdsC-like HAD superfamily phosphatase